MRDLADILRAIAPASVECTFVEADGTRYEWAVRSCTTAEEYRDQAVHLVVVAGQSPRRRRPLDPDYDVAREERIIAIHRDAYERLSPKVGPLDLTDNGSSNAG